MAHKMKKGGYGGVGGGGHDLVTPASYPGHDPGTYAPGTAPDGFTSPAVFCPHSPEPISVNQKRPGGERGGDSGMSTNKKGYSTS